MAQISYILFYGLCCARRFIHVLFQFVNMSGVSLQGMRNFLLEVVNYDKIWEEGEDILDFEEFRVLQEAHSSIPESSG